MIGENEFDRLLTSWLEAEGPQDVPAHVVEGALATARAQGQVGGWFGGLLGRRWPADPTGRGSAGGQRLLTIALIALLMVALLGAAAIIGGRRSSLLPAPLRTTLVSQPLQPIAQRVGHTVTLLRDGRLLIVGGSWGDETLASAEIFDPATDTFSATGPMAVARGYHSALLLADGRVLVAGGTGHDPTDLEVYDPALGRFGQAASLTDEPIGLRRRVAIAQLPDGRILAFGPDQAQPETQVYAIDPASLATNKVGTVAGCGGTGPAIALDDGRVLLPCRLAPFRIYDPATGGSTTIDVPTDGVSTLKLADGRVLFYGAGPEDPEVFSPRLFDPRSGILESVMTPFGSNDELATQLRDGRLLFLSGSRAAVWDPMTTATTMLEAAFTERQGQTWTVLDDGRLFVVGGSAGPPDGVPHPADAELIDPSAWTAKATPRPTSSPAVAPPPVQLNPAPAAIGGLVTPRDGEAAVELTDGRVLILGGRGVTEGQQATLASAEIYDPATRRFVETGSMTEPRDQPLVTRLHDGRVLVVGGRSETEDLASAEVYDPTTGTFMAVGSMAFARSGCHCGVSFLSVVRPTMTVLADGRVMIVGGRDTALGPAGRADIFDPGTGNFTSSAPIPCDVSRGTVTGLLDGTALVTCRAGDGRGSTLADWQGRAYIYDAESDTFAPTGAPTTDDSGIATLLSDGRVLLTGRGLRDSTAPAELFDPVTGTFAPIDDGPDLVRHATNASPYAVRLALDSGFVLFLSTDVGNGLIFDPLRQHFTPYMLPWPMQGGAAAPVGWARALLIPGSLDANPPPDPTVLDLGSFRPADTSTPTAEPAP